MRIKCEVIEYDDDRQQQMEEDNDNDETGLAEHPADTSSSIALTASIPDLAPLAPKSIQHGRLTYSQARQYLSDPLIEEVTEQRHITMGWHNARHLQTAVQRLVHASVGQFRSNIDGVPIAIGAIKFRQPMFILEDHNCMHIDVEVRMIAFRVHPGEMAPGEGQRVITGIARLVHDGKLISGTAYGSLGLVCSPMIPGVKPGDEFKSRFLGVQFRGNLCQIRTGPLNITRF